MPCNGRPALGSPRLTSPIGLVRTGHLVARGLAGYSAAGKMSEILYNLDMARVVPFTDARATLSDLLDLVESEQEHVVITRQGKPVAILMSVGEWESWEETIDVLSDPEAMEALRESEEDVKAGRLVDLDDLLRRYRGA